MATPAPSSPDVSPPSPPFWPRERQGNESWEDFRAAENAAIPEWIRPLPTRILSALAAHNLATKEAAAAALRDGTLRPGKTRGFGKKMDEILRKALGLHPLAAAIPSRSISTEFIRCALVTAPWDPDPHWIDHGFPQDEEWKAEQSSNQHTVQHYHVHQLALFRRETTDHMVKPL